MSIALPDHLQTSPRARRIKLKRKFGRKLAHPARDLPLDLLDQLDKCADDEARRLLLGLSK